MGNDSLKRPESVLVLVYTQNSEVLLIRRVRPAGFWQSVTGSMEWDETQPMETAKRELFEETGIDAQDRLIDCATTNQFPILPAWKNRFPPGVHENIERVFRLELPARTAIRLCAAEHDAFCWMAKDTALVRVSSSTNRAGLEQFVP